MSGCGCGSQQIHVHTSSGCGCKSSCNPITCRNVVKPIKELLWLQGLDENNCDAFQRVSDVLGLRDCAGNRVSIETPVVLCSDFAEQLCARLLTLATDGVAIPGSTLLVGSNCKLYTIPEPEDPGVDVPNSATDTDSVNITLSGVLNRNIQADVLISGDIGNILEIRPNGLYATEGDPGPTLCQQLADLSDGGEAVPGTILVGQDCQVYAIPEPEQLTVTDSSSIDLTLVGNNLQAALILDPAGIGNITGDGLLISCADVLSCAPPVTILDTQSINLNLVGQQLSADTIISPNADNALSLLPNGLYVDVCAALNNGNLPIPAIPEDTVLVGADCNRYTIPPIQNIALQDTTSVNLSFPVADTIQADVNIQPGTLLELGTQGLQVTCEAVQDCIFNTPNNFIDYDDVTNSILFDPSSDAGNQIVTGSDGRPYVPEFSLAVQDTDCINLTLAAGILSANPILSAQPGNSIDCLADGLFVPDASASIIGVNSNCIATIVNETPGPNQFQVTSSPIISPDADNGLECRGNGLYSAASSSIVVGASASCIDTFSVEGPAGTYTVSAVPVIDPDSCNVLVCNPSGLFVPEATSSQDTDIFSPAPFIATVISAIGGPVQSVEYCLDIVNPSDCRPATLTITLPMPWFHILAGASVPIQVRIEAEVEYNLPGVLVTPFSIYSNHWESTPTADASIGSHASDIIRTFTIPAGFVGNYCVRFTITAEFGSNITVTSGQVSLSYTAVTQ